MDISTLQFWVSPIVGAIIGLITNGIAIRMLFRPLKPVYIGKWQLPFTPGLIPKEQSRIARSVGKVVSEELFSPAILEKGLINDEIDGKITDTMRKFEATLAHSEESVRDVAVRYLGEETVDENVDWVEKSLAAYIYKKAVLLDIGNTSVDLVMKEMNERMNDSTGMLRMFSGNLLDKLREPIADVINQAVAKNTFQIVHHALEQEGDQLLSMKICDIYQKYAQYVPSIEAWILNQYHEIVKNNLASVLRDIHMDQLVEDQINSYSPADMERLLLELMKKELNAIVYLGGLLGFVMGFIMNFI